MEELKKELEEIEAELEKFKLIKLIEKRKGELEFFKTQIGSDPDETIFECLVEDSNWFVTNKQLKDKFPKYSSKQLKCWIKARYENVKEHTYLKSRGLKGIRII